MKRITYRLTLVGLVGLAIALCAAPAANKKKKPKKADQEPKTQVLELPKDPPLWVTAETGRLGFRVTPLSAKGLLSQQIRDSLGWLLRDHGIQPVRLRAFVAGSGDVRRVQALVSEMFGSRRLPLPALTVVQVGALPLAGAQVVIEATGVDKKPVNPNGLAFIAGQAAAVEQPFQPLEPLARKSVARLHTALDAAGLAGADVLSVTCFLSSLDDIDAVRRMAAPEFPQAALDLVQRMREPTESVAECEAVARLKVPPGAPLKALNPAGLAPEAGGSQVVLVGARRVVLSGAQLAFGLQEADARLAFERLGKTLDQAGTSYNAVASAGFYTLSRSIGALVRRVDPQFFSRSAPPAASVVPFEGLPGIDASFAVDVVAVLPDTP